MATRQDPRLVRTDDHWLHLPNRWDVPVDICANTDVPLETGAVDEVLAVLETAGTLRRLAEATPGTLRIIDRNVVRDGAGPARWRPRRSRPRAGRRRRHGAP